MENLTVIILGLAFYWLMIETNWLTVRLPAGAALPNNEEVIEVILNIAPTIIFIGLAAALGSALGGFKRKQLAFAGRIYTVAEHEEDMRRLWSIYGRKQPLIIGD